MITSVSPILGRVRFSLSCALFVVFLQATRSWDKLDKAIEEIFLENAGNLSFEELYRCCNPLLVPLLSRQCRELRKLNLILLRRSTGYNMVLHKHGEYLYEQVQLVLQRRSETLLERCAPRADARPDATLPAEAGSSPPSRAAGRSRPRTTCFCRRSRSSGRTTSAG